MKFSDPTKSKIFEYFPEHRLVGQQGMSSRLLGKSINNLADWFVAQILNKIPLQAFEYQHRSPDELLMIFLKLKYFKEKNNSSYPDTEYGI